MCAMATRARFLPLAASRQKRSFRKQSFVFEAAQAHSTSVVRSHRLPRGIFAGLALPPVQLFPGQTPAQELRCASEGNCAMLGTDLSENAGGSVLLDTGNRLQQFECLPELRLFHPQKDLGVNLLQLLFEKREVLKAELDQHSVVAVQPVALERLNDLRNLSARCMASQIRYLFDCCLTLQQSVQHQLPGHAEHIGENAADLYIGFFQNLLNPVPFAGWRC